MWLCWLLLRYYTCVVQSLQGYVINKEVCASLREVGYAWIIDSTILLYFFLIFTNRLVRIQIKLMTKPRVMRWWQKSYEVTRKCVCRKGKNRNAMLCRPFYRTLIFMAPGIKHFISFEFFLKKVLRTIQYATNTFFLLKYDKIMIMLRVECLKIISNQSRPIHHAPNYNLW